MASFNNKRSKVFSCAFAACALLFSGSAMAQVVGYVDNPQTNSTDWAAAVAGLGSGVNNNVDFEAHPLGPLQSDFYAASDGVTLTATGGIGNVVFGSGPNDGNTSGSNPGEGSHTPSNYVTVVPQPSTLTITFAAPTFGAGLFTIDKFSPNSQPMTIEAFTGPDGTGTSLGVFSAPAINFQPDNLYFMGVTSAAGDIQSVVFSYDGSPSGDDIGLDNIVFAGEGGDGPSGVVLFGTTVDFSNDFDGSVEVSLTCNAGTPLQQSFEISESTNVTFTVTNLIPTTGTRCEVAFASLDSGYTATATANGAVVAETCVFVGGTPATGESGFSVSGVNSCDIEAEPLPTTVTVNTTVEGDDDPAIDTSFTTTVVCTNVSADTGPVFGTVTDTDSSGLFEADWYAAPGETAECTATMVPNDMAVEGDSCSFSFAIGDEEAGCDVSGTVFFEGIPTLSQYGLALMALLMLGVGFVGMRRFV